MLYSISYTQENAPDKTGYNDPPVALREISAEEFAKCSVTNHIPSHMEFRQMWLNSKLEKCMSSPDGKMISAQLFWMADDTGYAISTDYWKGTIRYFLFGCNHDLEQKKFDASTQEYNCKKCHANVRQSWFDLLVEDSGWSLNEATSRPMRGIRDYERTIKFSREPSKDELDAIRKFLRKTNCPGWTGVSIKVISTTHYRFETCYDSSD